MTTQQQLDDFKKALDKHKVVLDESEKTLNRLDRDFDMIHYYALRDTMFTLLGILVFVLLVLKLMGRI